MNKLKLLIVEGNTKEENLNFNAAGCVSQSQNFKQHIQKLELDEKEKIPQLDRYDAMIVMGGPMDTW